MRQDRSFIAGSRLMSRFLLCLLALSPLFVWSQAPTVSYSSPQNFNTGTAISTLSPTSSNVPAVTYGNVTTYAGSGPTTNPGADNPNPLLASFNMPKSVVLDARGNMYVAESVNGIIRKIAANGAVTKIADLDGNSSNPASLAINTSNGDLYFTLEQHAIYRITNTNSANYPSQDPVYTGPTDGTLSGYLFAGSKGSAALTDGTGSAARFNIPLGMCIDASNEYMYVADYNNDRIRRITIAATGGSFTNGQVVTITTNGTAGVSIDGPEDLVIDGSVNLFVTSSATRRVHKITGAYNPAVLSDFAGSTSSSSGYVDGQGTTARFSEPRGIDIDGAGNLYVADGTGSYAIRKITALGYVSTLAGSGTGLGGSLENGVGRAARFDAPWDLVVDRTNHLLYVADFDDDRIRKVEIGGYTVWPPLPLGLGLNATTGAITGTPTHRSRQV